MPNTKNFGYSLVATAPSPATSGTSLVVTAADGAKFPTAPFNATIWPVGSQPTTANAEIVTVTNVSTDTLTITRAQESSVARTVIIGDQIAATITAGLFPTGTIVGTTDAQTVSGKVLSDIFEGNVFETLSATVRDITLTASTNFSVRESVEVGSGFVLEIPTTSSLEVAAYSPQSIDLSKQGFSNPYAFSVYRAAALTTTNTTFTSLAFDTKIFDPSNSYSTSNKIFTAQVAGFYWFNAQFDTVGTASNVRAILSLFKNGAEFKRGIDNKYTAATPWGGQVTGMIQLLAGDTVDVRLYSEGAGITIDVSEANVATNNFFEGFLISKI